MRGWAGLVPEISDFPTRISEGRLENFAIYKHFSPVSKMKAGQSMPGWHHLALHVLFSKS